MMKIANVRTFHLVHRDERARKRYWSGGYFDSWSSVLVQVEADDGSTGLGEVYQGSCVRGAVQPFVEHFTPWLLGEDPREPERLWRRLYDLSSYWNRQGYPMGVLGAIEIALQDLAAKAADKPLWELLAGGDEPSLPVYLSAGCTHSVEEMEREIASARADGFCGYKWRILEHRVAGETMRRLRAAAGADLDIMADAVQGGTPEPWSDDEVMELCRDLAPYHPTWIEEPYRVERVERYAELRRLGLAPVAGLEVVTCESEAQRFFEAGALDYFQPDVTVAGGITPVRRMIEAGRQKGVRSTMHSWGGAVSLMANLHAGLASPGCVYMELCGYENPLRDHLLVEPLDVRDGRIAAPRSPGLGVELSADTLERYKARDSQHAGLVFELH